MGQHQDSLPHANQYTHLRGEHGRCCRSDLADEKQPAFLCAFLYVCLGYIIVRTGPQHCRVSPQLYASVCIAGDFFSLVVQAIGGGVSQCLTRLSIRTDGPIADRIWRQKLRRRYSRRQHHVGRREHQQFCD